MARISATIPDELAAEINGELDHGDNRSAVVTAALREFIDEHEDWPRYAKGEVAHGD